MKRNLQWAGLLALGSGLAIPPALAGDARPLPTPFPQGRYQEMSARSPFAVAAATASASVTAPGFAAQLYLDGVAHVGKIDFVAIKSRDPDKPGAIFAQVGETTPDGIKIESVQWSDQLGKSTVDVSKGGLRATLIFDEAQMAKSADAAAALSPSWPGGTISGAAAAPVITTRRNMAPVFTTTALPGTALYREQEQLRKR